MLNLTNVINEPTRIGPKSSRLIDPIIVSDSCGILDSGTITVENEISDHMATYVCLQIPIWLSQSYYREVWNYKNANYEHLNDLIQQCDWASIIIENVSVDESCKKFTRLFLEFCKKMYSLQKSTYTT